MKRFVGKIVKSSIIGTHCNKCLANLKKISYLRGECLEVVMVYINKKMGEKP